MIILGIDPGSRVTGYAFLEQKTRVVKVLEYGVIRCKDKDPLYVRLAEIVQKLDALLEVYRPQKLAIEEVFFARNAKSALVLGQARGAIIATAARRGMEFAEFSPRTVKQWITGKGAADKKQVALMMQKHLMLRDVPSPEDASDALAIAWAGLTIREQ